LPSTIVWATSSANLKTSGGANEDWQDWWLHYEGRGDQRHHYEGRQRRIIDFQPRQTDEDREDRLRQRENTMCRQEAAERDIEDERSRLRIGGMRSSRAVATLRKSTTLYKFKLLTFVVDPAQVNGQIKSSMYSQLLGAFSGHPAAAYANACAAIAETAESLDHLSHHFGSYCPSIHRRLAAADSTDYFEGVPEAAAAFQAVSEPHGIIAGSLCSLRHSSTAFGTAVSQAEKAWKMQRYWMVSELVVVA